jgi:hypothetical protein
MHDVIEKNQIDDYRFTDREDERINSREENTGS